MSADTFRKLAALGLTTEQIAGVLELMDAAAAEANAREEARKAKGRERWHRWHDKREANVSKREQTLANNSRASVTRVEDNLQTKNSTGQEDKTISPEPAKAAPVVVGLPTASEGDFPISEADVAEWEPAFPAVDVRQQLSAMRQWLIANPTRRKTKRGMRKFVVAWLDRKQNSAPASVPRQHAPPGKQTHGSMWANEAKSMGLSDDEPSDEPTRYDLAGEASGHDRRARTIELSALPASRIGH